MTDDEIQERAKKCAPYIMRKNSERVVTGILIHEFKQVHDLTREQCLSERAEYREARRAVARGYILPNMLDMSPAEVGEQMDLLRNALQEASTRKSRTLCWELAAQFEQAMHRLDRFYRMAAGEDV